ncbi:MAG: hypothetical protein CVU63_21750 [Deltaproteobacteria bacterium HGW-Deltaproteobacteria-20]|jgi:hypothetical protein|nr:MAG: hypothetical protein CVU63_21750 [Deltaproteobacteria bacterium HGW-Deltaproteobacteria-20]
MTPLDALRKAYEAGNLIVFAGAGVSCAGGLPGWKQLANDLRQQIDPRKNLEEVDALLGQSKLIDALSALRDIMGAQEFAHSIEEALDDSQLSVPELAEAIERLRPRLAGVITTNLDRFIERAFRGEWPDYVVAPGDLAQRREFIFKIHGTLGDRSGWVFDRQQYDNALRSDQLQRTILATLFNSYHFLFVGFGLEDDDTEDLLTSIRALSCGQPPEHYAILQAPVGDYRRSKLQRAGIRIIEYEAHSDVLALLATLLPRESANPRTAR